MLFGIARIRAVGQLGEHAADLRDDLGMVDAERRVRLGVLGRELERCVERVAHLAGEPLRERLADRDRLAQPAERERVA